MKPQQVAQYQKAGSGFLITRNSATLADTDYEHIAKEIVDALNKRHAYPRLMAEIRAVAEGATRTEHCRALLRELGEE